MRYLKFALIFIYTIFALAFLITGAVYVWVPDGFSADNWPHDKIGHALLFYFIAFVVSWTASYLLKRSNK